MPDELRTDWNKPLPYEFVRGLEWIMAYKRGQVEGAQRMLRIVGGKRFGPLPPRLEAAFAGFDDIDDLEDLVDRLFDISSWDELLAAPGGG